jgi:hypothetical protein
MTKQATERRVKRSFTLTPGTIAFLAETRMARKISSDSEALDLLLLEARSEARRRQIDAAYKNYYDTASESDLAESEGWAEMAGPNVLESPEASEGQQ